MKKSRANFLSPSLLALFALVTVFAALTLISSCGTESKEKRISYEQVVLRLSDLRALAKIPAEGEYSGMFSSYDRRSIYDSVTDSYIKWNGNGDGDGKIRMEGDNQVLVEMEGPGAIVRIWSATPDTGNLTVIIDGEKISGLSIPFKDYFNTEVPLFNFPALVYETNAQGFNNYVPITFQKSIKIIGEAGWGKYFHFNYVKFPEGTELEPFNPVPSGKGLEALQKVNESFNAGAKVMPYATAKQESTNIKKIIQPGKSEVLLDLKGKYAITSIKAKAHISDTSRISEVLRKAVLRVRWDNQPDYAVWSPFGDFFGTAPGINYYETFVMGMNKEGMYSNWYMPFEERAEIDLFNESDETLEIEFEVSWEKLNGDFSDYGHFHAKWHKGFSPLNDPQRHPDWTLLKTKGAGRYVGTFLLVWNPKGGSCREFATEGGWWWGEGDEKFFVDGEKFPSTFGTGTEDYFGYAWCNPKFFNHALHSQSMDSENMGYQPVNRWHTSDNIPFHTSFEAYVEKYFPDNWPTQYSVVVYWYLDKNGTDPVKETPVNERYGFETQVELFVKPGVLEAEDLKVTNNTGGGTRSFFPVEALYNSVSGYLVRTWGLPGNQPAELSLQFETILNGKYHLMTNVVKNKSGSTFRVEFNDKPLKNKIYTYKSDKAESALINLGEVHLKPGTQTIKVIWEGDKDNPEGRVLALDYFELVR